MARPKQDGIKSGRAVNLWSKHVHPATDGDFVAGDEGEKDIGLCNLQTEWSE